ADSSRSVPCARVIVTTPSCRSHCRAFRGVGSIAATARQAENVNTAPSSIGAPRIAGRELETGTTRVAEASSRAGSHQGVTSDRLTRAGQLLYSTHRLNI